MTHLTEINNSKIEIVNIEKFSRDKFILIIFTLITCVKILLFPTYHSTDFEVHRNWLAITHSLPIKEWYTNAISQWTLDYPPFFGWFEYILSIGGSYVDSEMLKVDNLNYASPNTILFQRATVIFADLVFMCGVRQVGQVFCKTNFSFIILTILSLCNIGLLVVDHVHFQYNGFLLGILLLSLAKTSKMSNEVQILQGAFWFAVLLNLKHIYLYVAPSYGIWLLRSYCLQNDKFLFKFIKLGTIVIIVFVLSFGPFVHQLPQVLSRLFPFKRGLLHAYWAANAWALYAGIDKVLTVIFKKMGWLSGIKIASMTGGLVQEDNFTVLPTPTPLATFAITFLSMIPALWTLFFSKETHNKKFVKCIVLCGLSSFMFGWHVHEKAILTAIIPLCILATSDPKDAKIFLLLSSAGHTALFPLLYPIELTPLKIILWITYFTTTLVLYKEQFGCFTLNFYEFSYVVSLLFVTIYETVLHKIIFNDKLPFLPLALTSIYCAIGVTYSYLYYYYQYVFDKHPIQRLKKRESESTSPYIYETKKQL